MSARYYASGVRETHGGINFVAIVDREGSKGHEERIAFIPFSNRHPPLAQPDVLLILAAMNAYDAISPQQGKGEGR